MTAQPADALNVDALLDVVADYADQLLVARGVEDKNTMQVAAALEELYESKAWVAEWLEHKPMGPGRASSRFKADSRNRFAQWQAWKQQQRSRSSLNGIYVYRLLDARGVLARIPLNFATGKIQTEYPLRPLGWLAKNGYPNAIGEVWEMAVESAGSPRAVTHAHTKEALAKWKKDTLGPRGIRNAIKTSQAERARIKATADARELINLAKQSPDAQEELVKFLTDLRTMVNEAAGQE